MSTSDVQPFIGVEAQRIFLELREHRAAFNLVRDVVTLTHALHAGPAASELVNGSLTRVDECDTVEEIDAVFAAARASWSEGGLGKLLTTDKEGAWNRSAVVSGLSSAVGHLVDVGNPNNGFGNYLLRANSALEQVTGVDSRRDPKVLTDERLHFAHMDDVSVLPLGENVADVVAFRVSLHHMTKPVQEALIAEAARVVKPGGEILLVEDSWADRPGLTDNALTMRFSALDHAGKIATLSMIDVSSCLMYHETVAYPLSYRSSDEWSQLLVDQGATSVDITHWGFNMFTIYGGPMCIIRATIE